MDNLNERGFYPEDDWQSLSTPIVKKEYSEPENTEIEPLMKPEIKHKNKHPVLTIQLTLAVCVLLFMFVLKFLGTPAFDTVMSWYETKISESVLYNGNFESLDFSTMFATADEG